MANLFPLRNLIADRKRLINLFLVVFAVLAVAAPVVGFAQTAEPSIDIDPSVIFESTNTWIAVFDEIVAIGIGIAIALAVLTFLGSQILKAFRTKG